jgi:hypothetical protein
MRLFLSTMALASSQSKTSKQKKHQLLNDIISFVVIKIINIFDR